MRLTLIELHAVLNAVTATTAGELDGDEWTPKAIAAIERAETKLRSELDRREARKAAKRPARRNADADQWNDERRRADAIPRDVPLCSMCAAVAVPETGDICDACYAAYNTTPRKVQP